MTNCPQGQICLNKNFVIMIILLIIGLIVLGYLQNTQRDLFSLKKKNNNSMDNYYYLKNNSQIDSDLGSNSIHSQTQNINNKPITNRTECIKSPNVNILQSPPLNHINIDHSPLLNHINIEPSPTLNHINIEPSTYINQPPLRQISAINVPTRGYIPEFKQIGILHIKNKRLAKSNLILPLYGKPLYPGSSKWQYYSQTDGYNSMKIDIKFKGKNGMDDHGCNELSEGDIVRIPAYAQPFCVNLYNIDKPLYIPYI